jgi:hypothetical protein
MGKVIAINGPSGGTAKKLKDIRGLVDEKDMDKKDRFTQRS